MNFDVEPYKAKTVPKRKPHTKGKPLIFYFADFNVLKIHLVLFLERVRQRDWSIIYQDSVANNPTRCRFSGFNVYRQWFTFIAYKTQPN